MNNNINLYSIVLYSIINRLSIAETKALVTSDENVFNTILNLNFYLETKLLLLQDHNNLSLIYSRLMSECNNNSDFFLIGKLNY